MNPKDLKTLMTFDFQGADGQLIYGPVDGSFSLHIKTSGGKVIKLSGIDPYTQFRYGQEQA